MVSTSFLCARQSARIETHVDTHMNVSYNSAAPLLQKLICYHISKRQMGGSGTEHQRNLMMKKGLERRSSIVSQPALHVVLYSLLRKTINNIRQFRLK